MRPTATKHASVIILRFRLPASARTLPRENPSPSHEAAASPLDAGASPSNIVLLLEVELDSERRLNRLSRTYMGQLRSGCCGISHIPRGCHLDALKNRCLFRTGRLFNAPLRVVGRYPAIDTELKNCRRQHDALRADAAPAVR